MKTEDRETSAKTNGSAHDAALDETVHSLSEAVTTLADRLNALALRVALMGGTNDQALGDGEAYLKKLSKLVGAAGDQMRHIQELLQLVENTARRPDAERGGRSWHWPGTPDRRSDH